MSTLDMVGKIPLYTGFGKAFCISRQQGNFIVAVSRRGVHVWNMTIFKVQLPIYVSS
jgi:hypothetical protein